MAPPNKEIKTAELTHTKHTPLSPWVAQLPEVEEALGEAMLLDAQFQEAELMIHNIVSKMNAMKAAFLGQVAHAWTAEQIETAKAAITEDRKVPA